MYFQLDKSEKYPVYKQIIDQITNGIYTGKLKPGDRLPTEREFSIQTNISRGTIKRAYDYLASERIILRIQGNGTFIAPIENINKLGKKERALQLIDEMLDVLLSMNLKLDEVETSIDTQLQIRREISSNIRIAVVDCNMETLGLISSQIYNLSDVEVTEIVLNELMKTPERLNSNYDLVLTTKYHYLQVLELAPSIADNLMKVSIVPSQKTLFELAKVRPEDSVGIWCMSFEFAKAVFHHLYQLASADIQTEYHLDYEPGPIGDFLQDKDVLILPYEYPGPDASLDGQAMASFLENGGRIIYFEYKIDEGSVLHVMHEIDVCRSEKLKRFKAIG